jgi:hypothetical protein
MRYSEIIRLDENQAQYQQMLAGMVANDIISADEANKIVTTARTSLNRNDRIVWWLKWYRLTDTYYKITKILRRPDMQPRGDEFKKIFQKVTKTNYDTVDRSEVNMFRMSFENQYSLEHIEYQLTMPSIDQLVWDINILPTKLSADLTNLEFEHNARRSEIVTPKPGDKIILRYGKYAWVALDRGACSDEADAMGHCGNVPSENPGDRILSFRTILDDGSQKPHLTFILHKNGALGEMKGRANQKPNKKYHTYITDLLKQDFVKGIAGGGYAPENNFQIWDLQPAQILELFAARPDLIPNASDNWTGTKYTIPPDIQIVLVEKDPRWVLYIDNIIPELFADRPDLMPNTSDSWTGTKYTISPDIQPVLAEKDPNWALYIENLIPELKPLRKKLAYAIVTEPGLTTLDWRQYLTRQGYLDALDEFGDDTFIVKILQK